MTLSISFYDNIKYHRDDFIGRDKDFFGNGVVNATDFPITYPSPANMTLQLGGGTAWVDGYRIHNDSGLVTVTVPAANATNPRIDIIQVGHDDVNSTYSLQVKQGVAATNPVEPGADPNYIKLYAISVAANATTISSSNVTDRRSLVPLNVSGTQINYQGTITNNGGVPSFSSGTDSSKPTAGTTGRIYIATDTKNIYRDNGTSWDKIGMVTSADIGAVNKTGDNMTGLLTINNNNILQALSGGYKVQSGSANVNAYTQQTITFPVAFTNNPMYIAIMPVYGGLVQYNVTGGNNVSFTFLSNLNSSITYLWVAISS